MLRVIAWLFLAMLLVSIGVIGLNMTHSGRNTASISRRSAAPVQQDPTKSGFNPQALKDWEVMRRSESNVVDATGGFSPAAKKRYREMLALALKATFTTTNSFLSVELDGNDHDILVFCASTMNETGSKIILDALRTDESEFWNAIRFAAFASVVFRGNAYQKTLHQTEIAQLSHGYDRFVSKNFQITNSSNSQLRETQSDDAFLSPSAKQRGRTNLALALRGGLKTQRNPIEVEIAGNTDDILVFRSGGMDAATANTLLDSFRQDPAANFWNSLRLFSFNEVVFRGDNYQQSVPRSQFIQWSRNYEQYVSEVRKVVGQITEAAQGESRSVTPPK